MSEKINEILEIRDAKQKDISQLVRLHLANSHANELSVILGEAFVENFYKLCVEDPDVIIKLLAKNKEKVIGVSVIFFQYSGFYSKYKSIAIRSFPGYLLRGALNWKKLFPIFKAFFAQKNIYPSVIEDIDIFDKYVGQIIFDREAFSIPNGLKLFFKMYSDNISLLSEKSYSGMWGSCRVSNRSAIRISKSMGMIEFDRISSFPEDIIILVAMVKNQ